MKKSEIAVERDELRHSVTLMTGRSVAELQLRG